MSSGNSNRLLSFHDPSVTSCPDCGHPPIRHVPDGLIATCAVCLWMLNDMLTDAASGKVAANTRVIHVCRRRFQFKLSDREREQAQLASRTSYEPHAVCVQCACEWQQHQGYLCPSGDSLFVPLIDTDPGIGVIGDS